MSKTLQINRAIQVYLDWAFQHEMLLDRLNLTDRVRDVVHHWLTCQIVRTKFTKEGWRDHVG